MLLTKVLVKKDKRQKTINTIHTFCFTWGPGLRPYTSDSSRFRMYCRRNLRDNSSALGRGPDLLSHACRRANSGLCHTCWHVFPCQYGESAGLEQILGGCE